MRLLGVGAIEHRLDASPGLVHRLVHLAVDGVERRHVEKRAAYPRLIRRDDHPPTRLSKHGDGVEASRDRAPLVGMLDEVVAVEVDDAVAIEDEELHFSTTSFEISATWFMALFRFANRMSRLFLSSVFSTFTMTRSKNSSTGTLRDASEVRAS